MTDYGQYSGDSAGHPDDEFEDLLQARSELSHALRNEHDPGRRQELLSRLSENRAEILRLQRDLGLDSPQSAALRTSRSYLVDPWGAETSDQSAVGDQPAPPEQPTRAAYPADHPGDGGGFHYSSTQQGPPPVNPGFIAPSGPNPGFQGTGPMAPAAVASDPPANRTWIAVALTAAVALLAAVLAFQLLGGNGDTEAADPGFDPGAASDDDVNGTLSQISAVLAGMGLDGVVATERDGVIHLVGSVPTEGDRNNVIGAVEVLAGDMPIEASNLLVAGEVAGPQAEPTTTSRDEALQNELSRVLAATPIIFDLGQTELTELHLRILNNVVTIMAAYPDSQVTVVGFTDDQGTEEANRIVSLARAENVKNYLVAQGIPESSLVVEARGEDTSTGSEVLANLERRVELEVVPSGAAAVAPSDAQFRVAIVAPSAANDLAFTQSMVDAVNVIAAERGNVEVAVTDSTFVVEDASAAIRDYAAQGYDLVIAHGSQFGQELITIAPDHPDVAFAWGTASDTFNLPNVYAYDAASEEGGYVQGAMAALLSESGTIGVVGPIEIGDAERYVNGFRAGAEQETGANVRVTYTQSFSDVPLAAETAADHVANGADVMTGSAQMVVGAVSVASENGVFWFGTQANQASLDPTIVVASQVYHWEVILREIVTDIDSGASAGRAYTANLANQGLVIEFNSGVALDPAIVARGEALVAAIADGTLVVPS